jgi:hypothetical protein
MAGERVARLVKNTLHTLVQRHGRVEASAWPADDRGALGSMKADPGDGINRTIRSPSSGGGRGSNSHP